MWPHYTALLTLMAMPYVFRGRNQCGQQQGKQIQLEGNRHSKNNRKYQNINNQEHTTDCGEVRHEVSIIIDTILFVGTRELFGENAQRTWKL